VAPIAGVTQEIAASAQELARTGEDDPARQLTLRFRDPKDLVSEFRHRAPP